MDKLDIRIANLIRNRKARRKFIAAVALVFTSVLMGVGISLAYLNMQSELVTHSFAAADKFTLTYHGNRQGVTNVPNEQYSYITREFNISNTVPVYDGYKFTGWNTEENGGGTNVDPANNPFIATHTHTHLYAQWESQGYRLNYDANGGDQETVPETQESDIQESTHTFDIASAQGITHPVEGKVFAGWADTAGAKVPKYGCNGETYEGNYENKYLDKSVTLTAPNTEKRLYAVWMNKYELVFYPNVAIGGKGNVPVLDPVITEATAHTFTIPAKTADITPTKDNYNWGWWGPEENVFEDGALENRQFGDTVILTEAKPKEDYYAYYQPSQDFSLTYNANGGSGLPNPNPAKMSVTTKDPTFKIADREPTRTGYVFMGWAETKTPGEGDTIYKKDSGIFENRYYTFNRFISTETTLFAIWKPKVKYHVHFNFNRPNSDTYISGEEPSANGVFNYVAGYWKTASSGSRYKDEYHRSGETLEPSYTFTQTIGRLAVKKPFASLTTAASTNFWDGLQIRMPRSLRTPLTKTALFSRILKLRKLTRYIIHNTDITF